MIDYFAWSEEYEQLHQTYKRMTREKREMAKKAVSPTELQLLNKSIVSLNALSHEFNIIAKHLRKRAERYKDDV